MMILMTQLQDNHTDSQPVKLLYVCHIVIKRRQQLHQALYHIYRVSRKWYFVENIQTHQKFKSWGCFGKFRIFTTI